jgi:hypothetical protein
VNTEFRIVNRKILFDENKWDSLEEGLHTEEDGFLLVHFVPLDLPFRSSRLRVPLESHLDQVANRPWLVWFRLGRAFASGRAQLVASVTLLVACFGSVRSPTSWIRG